MKFAPAVTKRRRIFRTQRGGLGSRARVAFAEADIDSAILAAGAGPFELMVDVGVEQARMIQLRRSRTACGGFDTRQMLAITRASLDDLKAKAAVRFGDAYAADRNRCGGLGDNPPGPALSIPVARSPGSAVVEGRQAR
jgi:hypothetical protein